MSTATTKAASVDAAPASRHGALVALLAEFNEPQDLVAAARKVREAGYRHFDAHSPFPVHGIDDAIGIRATKLPWLVMACGVAGCLTGLGLQWWANASDPLGFQFMMDWFSHWFQSFLGYQFLISGKPAFSLPANIPVIFELTILFSAIGTVIAMLVFNNLPLWSNPVFQSRRIARATNDKFFLVIDARDPKFNAAETERMLSSLRHVAGVERIVDQDNTPANPPKAFVRFGMTAALLALIPLLVVAMARGAKSHKPRYHIIQDMDNQERFKAQQAQAMFADGRSMRPVVEGTIARGGQFLHEDSHYFTGLVNGQYATTFPQVNGTTGRPLVINEAFLEHGRQRFNIICATCHGRDGTGQGPVNRRALEIGGGWVQASNFHDAEPRSRAHGFIFNAITNGVRTMPAYGDRIPEYDRWAIVAYVRALQYSTQAPESDVPAEIMNELNSR